MSFPSTAVTICIFCVTWSLMPLSVSFTFGWRRSHLEQFIVCGGLNLEFSFRFPCSLSLDCRFSYLLFLKNGLFTLAYLLFFFWRRFWKPWVIVSLCVRDFMGSWLCDFSQGIVSFFFEMPHLKSLSLSNLGRGLVRSWSHDFFFTRIVTSLGQDPMRSWHSDILFLFLRSFLKSWGIRILRGSWPLGSWPRHFFFIKAVSSCDWSCGIMMMWLLIHILKAIFETLR